jgi:hypothetical protein
LERRCGEKVVEWSVVDGGLFQEVRLQKGDVLLFTKADWGEVLVCTGHERGGGRRRREGKINTRHSLNPFLRLAAPPHASSVQVNNIR